LQSAKLTMSKALPHLLYAYNPISQFYSTSFIYFCFIKVLVDLCFTGLVWS
jgi:hypothetical protein